MNMLQRYYPKSQRESLTRPLKGIGGGLFLLLFIFIGLLGALRASDIQAHSISPFYKDYLLYTGEDFVDSFQFTNTGDTPLDFNLFTSPYDPESEQFAEEIDRNFVSTISSSISVPADSTLEIPYTIAIPDGTPSGSYFSIIYLEEDEGRVSGEEATAQIRAGFGMIVALHIVEEGGSIKGAFTQLSDILVNVLDRGFPYLRPIQLTYRYENLSDYVFTPDGELRIFDMTTNERLVKERLNNDGDRVYPGRIFSEDLEFDLWNIENFTHDLRVVSRTYNQFDDAYLESSVIIPGINEWVVYGVLGGGLVMLFIASRRIRRKVKGQASKKGSKG